MGDAGWLLVAFQAGVIVGAVVASVAGRRRGHLRVTVELGDPPGEPAAVGGE